MEISKSSDVAEIKELGIELLKVGSLVLGGYYSLGIFTGLATWYGTEGGYLRKRLPITALSTAIGFATLYSAGDFFTRPHKLQETLYEEENVEVVRKHERSCSLEKFFENNNKCFATYDHKDYLKLTIPPGVTCMADVTNLNLGWGQLPDLNDVEFNYRFNYSGDGKDYSSADCKL